MANMTSNQIDTSISEKYGRNVHNFLILELQSFSNYKKIRNDALYMPLGCLVFLSDID